MNTTVFVAGIIGALILGSLGGFSYGKSSAKTGFDAHMQDMTHMMQSDGKNMAEMGGLMMRSGKMMQEAGTKYRDDALISAGKDLEVNGSRHEQNGKSMMDPNDMMGMPNTSGMDHSMHGMDM